MDFANVLSADQIEKIREGTEDLLESVGFHVENDDVLHIARDAGARVDETSGRVRVDRTLLRELLGTVPSRFEMTDLTGRRIYVGGGSRHGQAIVTDPWIIDYETQKPRKPCLDDLKRHTTIAQRLEPVVAMSCMDYPVTDYDDATSSLRALECHLLHHTKHYNLYTTSIESFHRWLEIGRILCQDQPLVGSGLFTVAVAIVSPLKLIDFNAQVLLEGCRHGFVIVPTICPMAGTTSPYTLASTLLLGNAESVFLAALTQMIKPGNPNLYYVGPSVSDMRSGQDLYYTLDKVLWKIAFAQMGQSYHMPVVSEAGGSLTHRYDQQSGAEGALFMLGAYASRSDIMSGFGSCHNANGMSAEMMIVATAWFDAVRFLCRGINTDDLHMGLPNIKAAGPGGNFLTDELTLKFMRGGEFFANDLFDFSGGYVGEESRPLLERAHERVEELTANIKPPVPHKVREDLQRFFHNEYRKMGSTD